LTQAKQYSATAQLLVQPAGSTALGVAPAAVTPTDVLTDLQLVTSAPVQRKVSAILGGNPSISATEVAQTNVIAITAISSSPPRAALIANTYAQAFVKDQQGAAITSSAAAEIALKAQIKGLGTQIKSLSRNGSTAEQTALQNQQAVLREQLAQMQVSGAAGNTGGVEVVAPAQAPTSPSSPKPVQDALLGLAAGLILGLGFAFLRDSLDDALSSKEAAEQLSGAPVLAMVPMVAAWKKRDQPLVVSVSHPLSPAAESYRSLRTSLQFVRQERPLRTLVVTSPAAAEGKTSTVANLGAVFAQAGERVVLVSCDLRRPRLAEFFGLDEQIGLTTVLLGEQSLADVVQPVSGHETLWLLGAGRVPANPAELLNGPAARELFAALRAEFDLVLIDSPPVLPVTDAAVLSKDADGTLMVVAAGQTKRVDLRRAAEKLAQVNAPMVGTVLNEVTRQTGYGYGSGYGYGYGYGDGYRALDPDVPLTSVPVSANGGMPAAANGSVPMQANGSAANGSAPARAANGSKHGRRR
jgi:capsular exopolysaccharide synthesis family protein